MHRITILVSLLGSLASLAPIVSQANSYLASDAQQWRCQKLQDWVTSIAAAQEDAGAFDIETAALGFAQPGFSRAFGRSFDNLTSRHRGQIEDDLGRCSFDAPGLAAALRVPFGNKGTVGSDESQRWLRAIYRGYNKQSRQQIDAMFERVPESTRFRCTPDRMNSGATAPLFEPAYLAEMTDAIFPLLLAGQFDANFGRQLQRRIDDLTYTIGTVERNRKGFLAPEIYLEVLETERSELTALVSPVDRVERMERYVAAVEDYFGGASERIRALDPGIDAFEAVELMQREARIGFNLFCGSGNEVIAGFASDAGLGGRLSAAMSDLDEDVLSVLVSIVNASKEEFLAEISMLADAESFLAYYIKRFEQSSLGEEALRQTGVWSAYSERRARFQEYVERVEAETQRIEESIRLEASVDLLFGMDEWERAPNQESSRPAPTGAQMLADVFSGEIFVNRDQPAQFEVIALFSNTEVSGVSVQWQLECDALAEEPALDLIAVAAGATLVDEEDHRGSGRVLFEGEPAHETTYPSRRSGRSYYVNTIVASLPFQNDISTPVRYTVRLFEREGESISPPLVMNDGVIPTLVNACYPQFERARVYTPPPFE